MISKKREEALIDLCRAMVRTPSLSGREEAMAGLVKSTMERLGFDEVSVDRFGNVVGKIVLGKGGKKILLEGHMDHVDISDPTRWAYDPYGGELGDGKIYGRGTTDMKGNLAAIIVAASLVKEDLAGTLDGEILVGGCVHEECFEGVASGEIAGKYNPDLVV
jgi:acetylornithine deacetylase/succinyl-diaminopimelate desuccinylase-like protein